MHYLFQFHPGRLSPSPHSFIFILYINFLPCKPADAQRRSAILKTGFLISPNAMPEIRRRFPADASGTIKIKREDWIYGDWLFKYAGTDCP